MQKCIYACIYNIFPPTKSCYQQLRHIIEWNGLWQKKNYRFTLINYFKWHDGGPSVKLLQIKYMYTCNYMMYHLFNNFYKNLDSTLNSSLWSPLFMSCLPVYLDIYQFLTNLSEMLMTKEIIISWKNSNANLFHSMSDESLLPN